MSQHGGGVGGGDSRALPSVPSGGRMPYAEMLHTASGRYSLDYPYPIGSDGTLAVAKEKHEDTMRHLLLKRLPPFRESWTDDVKLAWLATMTKLWEAA